MPHGHPGNQKLITVQCKVILIGGRQGWAGLGWVGVGWVVVLMAMINIKEGTFNVTSGNFDTTSNKVCSFVPLLAYMYRHTKNK